MVDNKEDDIIELTQVVENGSSDGADQEVIELTEIEAPELEETEGSGLELPEFEPEESAGELALEQGQVPGKVELVAEESIAEPLDEEQLVQVSPEQLEAALERVIENKFSQTIEKIMYEVAETVIKKEILDIKAGLQKDLNDIDDA